MGKDAISIEVSGQWLSLLAHNPPDALEERFAVEVDADDGHPAIRALQRAKPATHFRLRLDGEEGVYSASAELTPHLVPDRVMYYEVSFTRVA